MITFSGQFNSINDDHTISVVITKQSASTETFTIGNDRNDDIFFSSDPINISTNIDDTFQVVIGRQATITLASHIWLGDYLFAYNITDIAVKIYDNNRLIFDGYVEHNTYSQEYSNKWNELTLNCVDKLMALEKMNMSDATGIGYDNLRQSSNLRSFDTLLKAILGTDVAIYYDGSRRTYNENGNMYGIRNTFKAYSINDNVWLGESRDSMWSCKEIVDAMLKYMNLHIIQLNDFVDTTKIAYYIFDWDYTQRYSTGTYDRFQWDLNNSTQITYPIRSTVKVLGIDDYAGSDSNVTMSDVYTKISITESGTDINDIISNPLDTEDIDSPFTQANRYMTEFFVSFDYGKYWEDLFGVMLRSDFHYAPSVAVYDSNNAFFRHWYIQYLNNPNWTFSSYQFVSNTGSPNTGWCDIEDCNKVYNDEYGASPLSPTAYDTSDSIANNANQWSLLKAAWCRGYSSSTSSGQTRIYTGIPVLPSVFDLGGWEWLAPVMKGNCIGAAMFNTFSTDKISPKDASSPRKKANDKNWLVITTNNMFDSTIESRMLADWNSDHHAVCTYTSPDNQVASLVPLTDTTYYLVFTGKIVLSPFIENEYNYQSLMTASREDYDDMSKRYSNFKFGSEKGGAYTRIFYNEPIPRLNMGDKYNTTDYANNIPLTANEYMYNIKPYIKDDGLKRYEYKSYNNVNGDTIEKVGVLLCQLKIGDKYLVEDITEVERDGEHYYFPNNTYHWYSSAELVEHGLTANTATFTLGFDPKLGDYLIGQEYNIGTNISMYKNIGVDYGALIEVTKEDGLQGQVEFSIIGPCAIGWDDNHHYHGNWFRHPSVQTNTINVFCNSEADKVSNYGNAVENIYISEFKCTLYSDNGMNNIYKENDIIYMSDENTSYVEEKSDIEFKIMSGLTQDELSQFGAESKPILNNVYDNTGAANLTIYSTKPYDDNGTTNVQIWKPERLYVAEYYNEYKKPKILFEATLKYSDDNPFFRRYQMPFFSGKTFYPYSIEDNLKYKQSKIKLKEI